MQGLLVERVSRSEFERRFSVMLRREGRPFSARARQELEETWQQYVDLRAAEDALEEMGLVGAVDGD